jgi:N-acetylmuramoyl-L-alanine amidase
MNIDFRAHDSHEHGLTLTERVAEVAVDLQLAQRVRDAMRKQGMRVPLTETEAFEAAERRMRGGA